MQAQEVSSSFKALGSVGSRTGWIFIDLFFCPFPKLHPGSVSCGLVKGNGCWKCDVGKWCLQLCFLNFPFGKVSVVCSEIIVCFGLFFMIVDLGSQWLCVVASPSAIITVVPKLHWCALGHHRELTGALWDIWHFQGEHCNVCWMLHELQLSSCLDLTT